ncbi:phosphoglycerate kinase [Patescibacteria group bacterium]
MLIDQLPLLSDSNVENLTALVRVDMNVPIQHENVADDTKLLAIIPTIEYLMAENAKIILMSHLGRPEGKVSEELRLNIPAARLEELSGKIVHKLNETSGPNVKKLLSKMKPQEIYLLENVRFDPREDVGDITLAQEVAELADIFVNDAFSVSHRDHALVTKIATLLPHYAGLNLENELRILEPVRDNPHKPLTVIIGGAKLVTKIGLIKEFMKKADTIMVGGALAANFLAAEGLDIGKSLHDPNLTAEAKQIITDAKTQGVNLVLPKDVLVAGGLEDTDGAVIVPITAIPEDKMILDIGPQTLKVFETEINKAKTVIWNGPMGAFETPPFDTFTKKLAELIAQSKADSYIGGGETVEIVNDLDLNSGFTHISTGGGAMLEFMEGKPLPGIDVLMQ